ncbi:phosphonate C-P lyase system protein PhnG [uncultured Desulfobacter sp.]|uniref:phosphonate C-P lyase system protein PhnG n=1 Tax=uncultured Desulfobacter sp. TaxID=240139 RepID=UPI002AABD4D9|nr:phosphonate C-P lyase system protein PhnG [uncultured Desulfobacter sp.]
MKENLETADASPRQNWIRLLSNADVTDLGTAFTALESGVSWHCITGPETGLLMVQARADGTGGRFYMGEVSVTKCVVEIDATYMGYGMVTGSDRDHARLAALLDALLQHPAYHDELENGLLARLAEKQKKAARDLESCVAPTRVNFFTLKRGE